MKVGQLSGFLDFLKVDESDVPPEVHMLVFGNDLFNVPLDKEVLIDKRHITDNLPDINGGCQSNQPLDGGPVVVLAQVPEQVVAPEACSHHINRRVGVMELNSI
jgi:hypothetical protein